MTDKIRQAAEDLAKAFHEATIAAMRLLLYEQSSVRLDGETHCVDEQPAPMTPSQQEWLEQNGVVEPALSESPTPASEEELVERLAEELKGCCTLELGTRKYGVAHYLLPIIRAYVAERVKEAERQGNLRAYKDSHRENNCICAKREPNSKEDRCYIGSCIFDLESQR